MKEVWAVKPENKNKVENIIKSDDITSRHSISFRDLSTMNLGDGYVLIVDAPEEVLKRVEELCEGLLEKFDKKEEVLKIMSEEEDKAINGFGNIFG